jgi:Na+/H+ antiporter NhaD/arsenite permease-like protein
MTEPRAEAVHHQSRVLPTIGIVAMLAIIVAAKAFGGTPPTLLGVRAEFLLFGLTLLGVALLHHYTFEVAVTGLVAIASLKLLTDPAFDLVVHLGHEATILLNLLGLLLGFAILARHFEQSEVPEVLPKFLPDGAMGGFVLLCMVFVMSAFLDNIAAAMIGGTIALHVYKGDVSIGFLAALVAASNAGGAGSVLGDTTTTMMWIDGVPWNGVLKAFVGATAALLIFGTIGAWQQHRHRPIQKDPSANAHIQWGRIGAVALILALTITTNVLLDFPAAGVWIAILLCAPFLSTDWQVVPQSLKGSLFLVGLVTCASMMPVDELPPASWATSLGLGFVSSIFDNIPLTKLALDQGGYDWGILAYAVGFGGSMVWFGSSAGVAISNIFPRAKSVGQWVASGWHIPIAYAVGFMVMLAVTGWNPVPRDSELEGGAAIEAPTGH